MTAGKLQSGNGAQSTGEPYVSTAAIQKAVDGREIEVLTALGIQWDGKASHIRCPYPEHDDHHPSWRWNAAKKRAHCTCEQSASVFDVVMKVKSIDFEAAKVDVAGLLGRPDLVRRAGDPKRTSGGRGEAASAKNGATAQHPGCTLAAYAEAKKLPVDFLRSLGVGEISLGSAPAVRTVYHNESGAEAAVRFRIALDGKDKFRWRKRSKPLLYGLSRLNEARLAGYVILVEGESDAQTLWLNRLPALGIPGASNWNEARDANLLDGIEKVYLVVEPDQGGASMLKWLARSSIRERGRLVRLDGFKDPNALYSDDPEHFIERWRAALDASVPWREEADRVAGGERHAAWVKCKDLAAKPDILAEAARVLQGSGLVGEERAVKLTYLVVTSRVLPRIVSIAVKGESSTGKSETVKRVLELFPEEAAYALTSMSERALAYGEEPLKHRMLVVYEWAGLTNEFSSYLVRSLLSEGRIAYETVEKTADGLRARKITRDGPIGLIVTTTALRLHPENETRMLSFTVSDTPEQTRAILLAQAMRAQTGDAVPRTVDFAPWHALQRYIGAGSTKVSIPFAGTLASLIPPTAVRLRRDHPTILSLIQAHALLHQATRERDATGAVVATMADYSAVRDLAGDLVSEGVGATVRHTIRETVRVVEALVADNTAGISVTKLADAMKLNKSTASRRTKEATERGYLKNLEDKKGREARLVLDHPLPADVDVLPTRERLAECCGVAVSQGEIDEPPSPSAVKSTEVLELAETEV